MDKFGNIKKTLFFLFIAISLSVLAYAGSGTLTASQLQPSATQWLTTSDQINFTFTLDGTYNMSYLVNLTADWANGENNFSVNRTAVFRNGTNMTHNFTLNDLPDSPAGGWKWRLVIGNSTSNDSYTTPDRTLLIDNTTPTVRLNSPILNATNFSTTTVVFNATCIDNNPNLATLLFAQLGANQSKVYTNNTNTTFIVNLPDGVYDWNVKCSDDAGLEALNTTNVTITVDTTNPTVTINTPSNNSYINYVEIRINSTATDTNIDVCQLYLSNESGHNFRLNQTIKRPYLVSGLTLNWTNVTLAQTLPEKTYVAGVVCNDTVGNSVWSVNRTFHIDTVAPSVFNVLSPGFNVSTDQTRNLTTPDSTPNITWTTSADSNFDSYHIWVDTSPSFGTTNLTQYNVSGNTSKSFIIPFGDLNFDMTYFWKMNATDLAGNAVAAPNQTFSYTLDGTCSNLTSTRSGGSVVGAWNLCGIKRDLAVNLSDLSAETNAQIVAHWNETGHSWTTFTLGTSTNGGLNASRLDLIAFFINSSQQSVLWEDDQWGDDADKFKMLNWSNSTNSATSKDGYNIFTPQNTSGHMSIYDLAEIYSFHNYSGIGDAWTFGNQTNLSVKWWTVYKNANLTISASAPYVPFVFGRNINKNIQIDYGEAVWVYYNGSSYVNFNHSCTTGNNTICKIGGIRTP